MILLLENRFGYVCKLFQKVLFDDEKHDYLYCVEFPIEFKDPKKVETRSFNTFREAFNFYTGIVESFRESVPVERYYFPDYHGDVLPF